jgi:hypothetical protein
MLSPTGSLWLSDGQSNLPKVANESVKDDFLEDKPLTSLYVDLSIIAQICIDFYKRLIGSVNSQIETPHSYEKTVFSEALANKLAKQGIHR